MSQDLNVWLMPWADIGETISFGDITFWDFHRRPKGKKGTPEFEALMPKLADCFRDRHGNRQPSLCVLDDIASLNEGHDPVAVNARARWAAKAMAFLYICSAIEHFVCGDAKELSPSCSERFSAQCVSIVDGFIVESRQHADALSDLNSPSVFYFEPYLLPPTRTYPNRHLLRALARLNDGHPHYRNKNHRRLWHLFEIVFDWFSNAWTVDPGKNGQTLYVSMMIAFEALTRKDGDEKVYASDLAHRASAFCKWGKLPPKLLDTYKGKKGKEIVNHVSEPVKWIIEYAEIRNRMAHGSYVPWGFWNYITPIGEIEPRAAMSVIVQQLVMRHLIESKLFDADDRWYVLKRNREVMTRLGWGSSKVSSPSPSLTKLNEAGDPRQWKYWPEESL